jgi:hypothetical protein
VDLLFGLGVDRRGGVVEQFPGCESRVSAEF